MPFTREHDVNLIISETINEILCDENFIFIIAEKIEQVNVNQEKTYRCWSRRHFYFHNTLEILVSVENLYSWRFKVNFFFFKCEVVFHFIAFDFFLWFQKCEKCCYIYKCLLNHRKNHEKFFFFPFHVHGYWVHIINVYINPVFRHMKRRKVEEFSHILLWFRRHL